MELRGWGIDACRWRGSAVSSIRSCVLSPTGLFWRAPKEAKRALRGHPLKSPVLRRLPNWLVLLSIDTCSLKWQIICPARPLLRRYLTVSVFILACLVLFLLCVEANFGAKQTCTRHPIAKAQCTENHNVAGERGKCRIFSSRVCRSMRRTRKVWGLS